MANYESRNANLRAKWQLTSSSHAPSATLDYDTPYDNHWTNVGDWVNSAGAITIPEDGTYRVTASAQAPPANGSFTVDIDNVDSARISITDPTTESHITGSCTLDLLKGEVLTVSFDQAAPSLITGRNSCLEIIRVV